MTAMVTQQTTPLMGLLTDYAVDRIRALVNGTERGDLVGVGGQRTAYRVRLSADSLDSVIVKLFNARSSEARNLYNFYDEASTEQPTDQALSQFGVPARHATTTCIVVGGEYITVQEDVSGSVFMSGEDAEELDRYQAQVGAVDEMAAEWLIEDPHPGNWMVNTETGEIVLIDCFIHNSPSISMDTARAWVQSLPTF